MKAPGLNLSGIKMLTPNPNPAPDPPQPEPSPFPPEPFPPPIPPQPLRPPVPQLTHPRAGVKKNRLGLICAA
jgi:hypothetical protein